MKDKDLKLRTFNVEMPIDCSQIGVSIIQIQLPTTIVDSNGKPDQSHLLSFFSKINSKQCHRIFDEAEDLSPCADDYDVATDISDLVTMVGDIDKILVKCNAHASRHPFYSEEDKEVVAYYTRNYTDALHTLIDRDMYTALILDMRNASGILEDLDTYLEECPENKQVEAWLDLLNNNPQDQIHITNNNVEFMSMLKLFINNKIWTVEATPDNFLYSKRTGVLRFFYMAGSLFDRILFGLALYDNGPLFVMLDLKDWRVIRKDSVNSATHHYSLTTGDFYMVNYHSDRGELDPGTLVDHIKDKIICFTSVKYGVQYHKIKDRFLRIIDVYLKGSFDSQNYLKI